MKKRVITFGEIMLRLATPGYLQLKKILRSGLMLVFSVLESGLSCFPRRY